MFKIIKASDGTVLALTEDVTYIKKADNDLESGMLEQTDIGSWVTETQTAIEDADALNVDQEYRLTLLELGITDDTDAS